VLDLKPLGLQANPNAPVSIEIQKQNSSFFKRLLDSSQSRNIASRLPQTLYSTHRRNADLGDSGEILLPPP